MCRCVTCRYRQYHHSDTEITADGLDRWVATVLRHAPMKLACHMCFTLHTPMDCMSYQSNAQCLLVLYMQHGQLLVAAAVSADAGG